MLSPLRKDYPKVIDQEQKGDKIQVLAVGRSPQGLCSLPESVSSNGKVTLPNSQIFVSSK